MSRTDLNPCIKCGGEAHFVLYGYGKNHEGTKCGKCGQEIDSDNSEQIARKEWNKANPLNQEKPCH